ncbi:traf-interacting protein [Plakobranchus ocellatus]|uniref:Traf-interacting protein n=1 Tax=Plakobranchus ocellatus TaxID=259542 RepID=A0AAV3YNC5_9GAST|nr:traf-interacting protein [Plakobranchus ocellatus]
MGVCVLHWPEDTELVRTKGRYYVPAVPLSIFENIPESCIPSVSKTTPHSTEKALSATRVVDMDKMETFMDRDKLKEDTFFNLFKTKSEALGLFAADHLRTNFALFSKTRTGPIRLFSVYFTLTVINSVVTLQYEAYQNLKRVFHPSIKASIRCWSELDELLRYAIAQNDSKEDLKEHFISGQETAKAITWTCKCLIELAKYFLTTSTVFHHQYVALGFYQQDDIEEHFAHFRMSAGSNYCITTEDVANMHAIDTAKLLSECSKIDVSTLEPLHQCYLCEKCLTDKEILTLDELPNKICELSGDEKNVYFPYWRLCCL